MGALLELLGVFAMREGMGGFMKSIISILIFTFVSTYAFAQDGLSDQSMEELKLQNIKMPVMYGMGAGGVTLGNTLDQSKKLLTPPRVGPSANGVALYDERVMVMWGKPDTDGRRFPVMISVMRGYLGRFHTEKFGDIGFQTTFPEYQKDGKYGAEELTMDLYNDLEKTNNPDLNCLDLKLCRMIYGDDTTPNFMIILPGAVFLVSKEEFRPYEIRIQKNF